MRPMRPRTSLARPGGERSPILTIFWHCGGTAFSSRTTVRRRFRQRTVNGFGRGFWGLEGSGNADSQAFGWSSGRGGDARACDSGCCEGAHPASWRASPSYRPLRAVWAVCAWALRGCARTPKPFSAHGCSATYPKGIFVMTTAKKSEKDRVIIFDTTLRDGEQCPGATMTFEEKLEVAEMLDD